MVRVMQSTPRPLFLAAVLLASFPLSALMGCGGSTPSAAQPEGAPKVAAVELSPPPAKAAAPKDDPAPVDTTEALNAKDGDEEDGQEAGDGEPAEGKQFGMIGLLNAGGDSNAPAAPWG